MDDLTTIHQLSRKLNKNLKQMKKIVWFSRGFQLNEQQQVTHLSIFRAGLDGQWPEELFQLKHLEYLDIRENDLNSIPDAIMHLQQLNCLDVRLNQIDTLPSVLSELPQLKKLYLGNNRFTTVPETIEECQTIQLLDFTNNAITDGCEYLFHTPSLKQIYLNNNQITNFPFKAITNPIEELSLSNNPIENKEKHHLVKHLMF